MDFPDKGRYKEELYHLYGVLIASMASSIIFLSAGTRRGFPVEVLSRDVSPVSAMCIVSSTSSICSSSICCVLPC